MGKIDAHTDVSSRSTFTGLEIPPYGVLTDHQAELEKVHKAQVDKVKSSKGGLDFHS